MAYHMAGCSTQGMLRRIIAQIERTVLGPLLSAGPFGFQPEIWGDLVLVASAGFWSLVMVRQSRHAPDYPSFPLGTYKAGLCTLSSQFQISTLLAGTSSGEVMLNIPLPCVIWNKATAIW